MDKSLEQECCGSGCRNCVNDRIEPTTKEQKPSNCCHFEDCNCGESLIFN